MTATATLTPEEEADKEFDAGYNDPIFTPAGTQAAAEKAETDRVAAEKAEADRVAAAAAGAGEQTEEEKAAAEKAEADRVAAEKAEADRVAAAAAGAGEQTEEEKAAAEKAEADRVAAAAAGGKGYQPDYAKLLKDTAEEIKSDNREAISRLTAKKPRTPKPDDQPDLTKTAEDISKALEGLSDEQVKSTLQKVRDTDPETADAIEGLVSKVTGTVGSLAKAVDTLRLGREADNARTQEATKAAAVSQVEMAIAAKHPNFREIVGSADGKVPPTAEFTKWFKEQPAYVQETARNTEDPNVFASVLDKYVTDTKPPEKGGEKTEAEKAIEEAQRAGAQQPGTKAHTERKATGVKALSDEDEFMKGYNDPSFDKKK